MDWLDPYRVLWHHDPLRLAVAAPAATEHSNTSSCVVNMGELPRRPRLPFSIASAIRPRNRRVSAVEQVRALRSPGGLPGLGAVGLRRRGFKAIHGPAVADRRHPDAHATSFLATALSFAAVRSASTSSKV